MTQPISNSSSHESKEALCRKELFINRELSWLEFNTRVLAEALDPKTPLLEQLKFLAISASNFDEFFMVRVSSLRKRLNEGIATCPSPDELAIDEVLAQVFARAREQKRSQYLFLLAELLPNLAQQGVSILPYQQISESEKARLEAYFDQELYPILTPMAVDPSHPPPHLSSASLYLLIEFEGDMMSNEPTSRIGFVEVPALMSRLISIRDEDENKHSFLMLEDLIEVNLNKLFFGLKVKRCYHLRVLRNFDYTLMDSPVVDLLETIQREVGNRHLQEATCVECSVDLPEPILQEILAILSLSKDDVFFLPAPLHIPGLLPLYNLPLKHLKEPPFNPRLPARLKGKSNIFSLLKSSDLLVHHPYESFYTFSEFLSTAASDPQVLAIKQTLYRTSGDSPIIDMLVQAAKNGKQVTAVVELKARFDEKNNIGWARYLERAGVNVVYGSVGLKTHCKISLIVRREKDNLCRYAHLSTGNYNTHTAKMYCDLGFFTASPIINAELSCLFNLLTGFDFSGEKDRERILGHADQFKALAVAPLNLRAHFLAQIDWVIAGARAGEDVEIFAKMNALIDGKLIEKLYEAGSYKISARLLVRGPCALRPGLSGISETIEVRSIIDRFLEHSRIYYFRVGKEQRIFLGSADWMSRCMDRRVDVSFPITEPSLKSRVVDEIIKTYWQDNCKARRLNSDGTYAPVLQDKGETQKRAQHQFIQIAREEGLKSIPYDKAIRYDLKKRGSRPFHYSFIASQRGKKDS